MNQRRKTDPNGAQRPLAAPASLEELPPPDTTRWVPRRKAQVVAAVESGLITVDGACQRYNLTLEEFLGWQRAIERSGVKGLRMTLSQFYRETAANSPQESLPADPIMPGPSVHPEQHERRGASRLFLILRVAKLIVDDREQFCIIRDASATGLKIKLFAPLPRHDELAIEVANGDRYPCRCVWTEDDSVGVQFLQPIDLERFLGDAKETGRRQHLRLRLALQGRLHLGETATPITFYDISQFGAAFKTDKWLLIDEMVKIETSDLPLIYAKVRWRNHPNYGVSFENPFQLKDFAGYLAKRAD